MSNDKNMPETMDLSSMSIAEENKARLKALFPSVFTETRNEDGELAESIDFEKLKTELGTFSSVFEKRRERYGMDWPGKKDCMKLIQQPSVATLKPCREESVNFDDTENLFIEGDNLEALKLLQKSYYGKVKMIYIDPPFNTGNEFIYPDKYSESLETYLAYAGIVDSEGRVFSTNTANEGRFHTKWLNMMYPRLYLARTLLNEQGMIFISIGSEELYNLISMMNNIFGEECSKNIIVIRRGIKSVQAQFDTIGSLNRGHEYVVFYTKSSEYRFEKFFIPRDDDEELAGSWNNHWRGTNRPTMRYEIFGIKPASGQWRWGEERSKKAIKNWEILCEEIGDESKISEIDLWVRKREEKEDVKIDLLRLSRNGKPEHYVHPSDGKLASDLWTDLKPNGSAQLKAIMGGKYFDTPKSVDLLKRLIDFSCSSDDIILDFFSGSCTSAQAALELGNRNGLRIRFVMIQLPEPCNDKSEAYKAGFQTIAGIGKERIRRVIKKIQEKQAAREAEGQLPGLEEEQPGLDLGFKVFKLDRSNFKLWDGSNPDAPEEEIKKQLELHIDHIDPKAGQEDLLYELLLKAGFMPTEKVKKLELAGKVVYSIAEGALLICLEDEITRELLDAVAEAEPMHFICLDKGFQGNDQLKANAVQTFAARNQGRDKAERIVFRTV